MARSDLLLTLVRAGISGDKGLLRVTIEALAADERAKKHTVLANKLARLANMNGHNHGATTASLASMPGHEYAAETNPQRTLAELVLTDVAKAQVEALVEEQHRADLLRSYGLQPRHRVLLSGPPGNGKTALSEAIAEALAVPFYTVRYDTLIGSFLGETTQRLRKLFDFVRSTPCVLLFDEFDAIGKERGDVHETGEIKRVVSSLLLQIDTLPSYVVVIAATNHAELLDRAVWRRFQLRLALPAPTEAQLANFLRRALSGAFKSERVDTASIAKRLAPVSYAEASEFLIDLRRRHVLSLERKRIAEIISEQLPLWTARGKVLTDGQRSNPTPPEVRPTNAGRAKKRKATGAAVAKVLPDSTSNAATRTKAKRSGKSAKKGNRSARTSR
jgi:SpoVK/Ycf46/Vps4 family AAA+-type ATPase